MHYIYKHHTLPIIIEQGHIVFSHEKALEGITICGDIRGQERFTPIIQGLSMEDPNMKVRFLIIFSTLINQY